MFNLEVPLRNMLGVWCAVSAIKIINTIFLRAQMLTDMSHIH